MNQLARIGIAHEPDVLLAIQELEPVLRRERFDGDAGAIVPVEKKETAQGDSFLSGWRREAIARPAAYDSQVPGSGEMRSGIGPKVHAARTRPNRTVLYREQIVGDHRMTAFPYRGQDRALSGLPCAQDPPSA